MKKEDKREEDDTGVNQEIVCTLVFVFSFSNT